MDSGHLLGREAELAAVEAFLEDARPGAAAFVLEGAAGVGKTTVWEEAVARVRARGIKLLVARPSSEEARFGFSALADLLAGVDRAAIDLLPPPQRRALEAALLVGDGAGGVDARAVSAAVLGVLAALAAGGPVVVAVDDVQWLDPASAGALAYAARRLRSASVHILLTRRTPGTRPSAIERAIDSTSLDVPALSFGAIGRVLHLRLGVTFSRATSLRIYEASGGNPLFALELARVVDLRRGRLDAADDVELPAAVETALGERLATLSAPARRALLAAELAGTASAAELETAVGADAIDAAETAGVVRDVDGRLRPSHPLVGAAAKARARPAELRRLHRMLAGTAADPERVARHLALAQRVPDEETAAVVAAAASHAARRGAAASAAELGEYALRLTPRASDERVERLLAAAAYRLAAGELLAACDLLEPELDGLPRGPARARAMLLLNNADSELALSSDFLAAALDESRDHPSLHATILATLAANTAVARVERVREATEWAEEAVRLAAEAGDPEAELFALTRVMWLHGLLGEPSDAELARYRTLEPEASVPILNSAGRAIAVRGIWRGDHNGAREELHDLLRLADERGEAESYFVIRLHLCELELRAGRFETVAALLEEWAVQSEEPAGGPASFIRCAAQLAAGRGDVENARRLAAEAIAVADATHTPWQRLEAQRALGTAELLAGRPAAAVDTLLPVWEHVRREGVDDPGAFPVAPELVEALAATGELERADAVAAELLALAEAQDHPWGLAAAARARGHVLVARREDALAASALEEAAARYGDLDLPFDRARTLVALGAARRRLKQVRAGREALEEAAAVLSELGADGWAERARAELARFSGRRGASGLTPTEERVVDLVVRGLSNRQVAAELVVSVSAVERHLTRIYRKLGVRGRSELARLER